MLFADESPCVGRERGIPERLLDDALAVVERAVDRKRPHVLAPARELLRLARRDEALRIEQHDVDPGPAMEGRGHGAARVAGGRDEDRDLAVPREAVQPFERGRQEARAEILERARRAVKELEHARRGRARARAARAAPGS